MKPLDLQVNGYAGVDFCADGTTPEQIAKACRALREDGVGEILATVITDHVPKMANRFRQLVKAREADKLCREMILGFHIEGPFISPENGYRGAHPLPAVKPANVADMKKLLEACGGLAKLVTLAPEHDAKGKVTQFLAEQKIVVSAGHCNPSLDQLKEGIDNGMTMFTHVGNGCPMQMHRHDNIIQRALSLADKLWMCFIPDGVHIDFTALKNYIKCAGLDRTIAVTDAISAARLGPGKFTLAGWDLVIGEDLVARSPDGSHFVGSTVTMPRLTANLKQHLGMKKPAIDKVTCRNPRLALGLPVT